MSSMPRTDDHSQREDTTTPNALDSAEDDKLDHCPRQSARKRAEEEDGQAAEEDRLAPKDVGEAAVDWLEGLVSWLAVVPEEEEEEEELVAQPCSARRGTHSRRQHVRCPDPARYRCLVEHAAEGRQGGGDAATSAMWHDVGVAGPQIGIPLVG